MWTEESLSTLSLVNAKYILDKSLNPGLRADLLRLEILYQEGGIYVDTDMAYVGGSLDDFLGLGFFIGVSNTLAFELNNAIIGSCK